MLPIGLLESPDMHALNLTSISGITVATMAGVEIIKRLLKDAKWFACVPVWVYACAISISLAFFANKVVKTNDGTPVLAGDTVKVLWAAALSALSASGFYTWLRNPEPIKTASSVSADKGVVVVGAKSLTVALFALFLVGCACPEKAILREGMDQGTRSIRANEEKWADLLTVDPATGTDHRDQLPKLTPAQNQANKDALRAYEKLVADDRARDGGK